MRVSKFLVVLSVVGAAFLLLGISNTDADGGMVVKNADSTYNIAAPTSRKLKVKVELEDYRPYDPSPSSKASIRSGPIEHGTPLMPFIPNTPSPPASPNNVYVGTRFLKSLMVDLDSFLEMLQLSLDPRPGPAQGKCRELVPDFPSDA